MSAAFRFRLDIEEHGWARLAVEVDSQAFETSDISFVTDALGDLARAAADLVQGMERSVVRFDGEPVETRLVIERVSAVDLRLRVLRFANFNRKRAADPGAELFNAIVPIDAFARGVLRDADRIRNETGEAAYEKSWNRPYPARDVEALRAARKT